MSYCHACSGSYSNIDYTFGGKYADGHRYNVNSYLNANLTGDVSFEPRRVSSTMYNHVSTRGMCTEVSNRVCLHNVYAFCVTIYSPLLVQPPPPVPTSRPTSSPSSSKPSTSPSASPTFAPSQTPTRKPSALPSAKPTSGTPTTRKPITLRPSRKPTTSKPSLAPTTQSPTNTPTTVSHSHVYHLQ